MVITGMEYVPALHYELQTFTERRETCWSYAPHRPDTKLDLHTPERPESSAPLPWQIEETPGRMFRDEVRLVTVPNTGDQDLSQVSGDWRDDLWRVRGQGMGQVSPLSR